MNEIEKLAQYFARFPGIGSRQSKRFVYFLLSSNPRFAKEFSLHITTLFEKISQCGECRRYFESINKHQSKVCSFCEDVSIDQTQLLVTEKDVDLENILKSGAYKGKFFVLGSLIPLTEIKNATVFPRVNELYKKIEKEAAGKWLNEVILALSASPEGDHTSMELKIQLKPLEEKYGVKITTLGRGLSTGSELEYADSETIKNALTNRKD